MKFITRILALAAAVLLPQFSAVAQTNAPMATATNAVPVIHTNTALIAGKHKTQRTDDVLQRARENPGAY